MRSTGFLAWKMTQAYAGGGQLPEFHNLLFGIPMVTCAAESAVRKTGVTRAAIVIGVILGLVNFCSVRCSLQGIQSIPAIVFFPVYSCGGLIVNTLLTLNVLPVVYCVLEDLLRPHSGMSGKGYAPVP